MNLLSPSFWLAVVLWTAAVAMGGYWKGKKDNEASHLVSQIKAEREDRETEQEMRRLANRDTSAYIARERKQQERADALPPIILTEDCTVPAAIGRVLNDAQKLPDDAGTGPGARATAQTVDSTCAAELDICKRNYAEVAIPTALQLQELQKRWNDTRNLMNKGATP